jgi:hypothetical protein
MASSHHYRFQRAHGDALGSLILLWWCCSNQSDGFVVHVCRTGALCGHPIMDLSQSGSATDTPPPSRSTLLPPPPPPPTMSSISSASGWSSAPGRTKALSAWARVADWSRCACHERTLWHLRHLQEPIQTRSEEGITVGHLVTPAPQTASPSRPRKQRRRRRAVTQPQSLAMGAGGAGGPGDVPDQYGISPNSPPAPMGQQLQEEEDSRPVYLSATSQVGVWKSLH